MQRVRLSATVLLLTVFFFLSGFQTSSAGNVDWDQFSVNLVKALKSDNIGLRQSAMNLVIKYSDKLDVNDAVFDVTKVFRSSNNEKERQLALITLYKMQNNWSMDFLKRHMKYEKNETIKHQIQAIVYEYYGSDDSKLVYE